MTSMTLPRLRFDYTVTEISSITSATTAKFEASINAIEAIPLNTVTFDNVIGEFSRVSGRVAAQLSPIFFLQHVSDDEEIREASRTADNAFKHFTNQIFMRSALYLRFKQIEPTNLTTNLNSIQQKLLKDYLSQFKHLGVELSPEERQELFLLINEMDTLGLEFDANISDDLSHLILKSDELLGLDQDYLTRTETETPGEHKITYKYPDVNPILENCSIKATREKIINMRVNRCAPNLQILERLHQLRLQIANKIGYSNYVDYQLSDQMMTQHQMVGDFLQSILKELEPSTRQYIETLAEMKNTDLQPNYYKRPRLSLGIADYAYYHNRYLKEHCQVDSQAIKEYFPAEKVIKAMLIFYSHMFRLKFIHYQPGQTLPKNWTNLNVSENSQNSQDGSADSQGLSQDSRDGSHLIGQPWHSDVLTYLVEDDSGKPMGYFYMDLYPRDGKYTHYAMWDLVSGYQDKNAKVGTQSGSFQVLPVAGLVGNFPEPVGDKPSLLDISEVETMFHEFGHVLHGICGGAENCYVALSGTNTETDFVEAPSQMKEQWVYEPKILKSISSHYKTGKCLPDDLIQSIVASRHIGVSYDWTRITAMALVDWEIHRSPSEYNYQAMVKLMEQTMSHYTQHACPSGRSIASWGHIGSDNYSGRYYSYVLTMVLASDLYSRFEGNPINPKIGLEYRQKILSPGGTKPGAEMIRDFLGRDPTVHSFLKNFIGIETTTAPADLSFII